jgi:hypothetical protein
MTVILVVGAVIVATVLWRRAMAGKPRAWFVLMVLCVASGIWHTATYSVFTGAWLVNALGLALGLMALTMYAARNSR